jgi:hypothetical protein
MKGIEGFKNIKVFMVFAAFFEVMFRFVERVA